MGAEKCVRVEDAIAEEMVEEMVGEEAEVVAQEDMVVCGPDGERYLRKTTLTTYQIVAGEGGRRVWDPASKQVQEYVYVGEPEAKEEGKGGG